MLGLHHTLSSHCTLTCFVFGVSVLSSWALPTKPSIQDAPSSSAQLHLPQLCRKQMDICHFSRFEFAAGSGRNGCLPLLSPSPLQAGAAPASGTPRSDASCESEFPRAAVQKH